MPSQMYNRRLSASDASFLYGERKSAPMQIGGLGILEGDLTYEEFVANVTSRLQRIERFRQRVVPTPFNIAQPSWERDPDFDIRNHLFVHDLPAPGTEEQLRDAVSAIYSMLLPRNRPLWQLHLFRGLENNRFAVASSIHHAMVDGVGSNDILTSLYDIQPDVTAPPADKFEAKPIPPAERLIADAFWDSQSAIVDAWSSYSQGWANSIRQWDSEEARESRSALQAAWPKLISPFRRLPFNRTCSGERHLAWSEFSFADFRAIRSALGLTVNDVVLTVLAGGMGRYAELHGQSTVRRMLKLMVPVNTRQPGTESDLGNQVSVMPTNVPLGEKDPLERARQVAATTDELKQSGIARDLLRVSSLMGGMIPASYQAALGLQVNPLQPPFNMVCTNVPGPQIPLYFAGRRMQRYLPMVPIGHQMGLGAVVFTYNQRLVIGLTADKLACPDVDRAKQCIDESFEELRMAAGVDHTEPIEIPSRGMASKHRAATNPSNVNLGNTDGVTTGDVQTGKSPEPTPDAPAYT